MQIVIEMDDMEYQKIMVNKPLYPADASECIMAIQEGTPLPKGHGRLIDADKLINTECGHSCSRCREECGFNSPCKEVKIIENAPTIIPAEEVGE